MFLNQEYVAVSLAKNCKRERALVAEIIFSCNYRCLHAYFNKDSDESPEDLIRSLLTVAKNL